MTANVYEVLASRGFVYQCTDEPGLRDLLGRERIACYVGFDPTAESLHVGSLVPLLALRHMRRAGHTVILVCGSATAMVGDPSGKQKMRPMMGIEEIQRNSHELLAQLLGIVDAGVDGPPPVVLDNASWLRGMEYIEFLRTYGRYMSVNRMLARESARRRFDSDEGLSLLEFNYACLQACDFLHLHREHGCRLQMGGQDQWGNICEGIDLISRPELGGGKAYGLTFPLMLSSSGEKFGKTAEGAVWLDASRTAPFDFYQFWRNADDADVVRFLLLFTDLAVEAVRAEAGTNVNRSKEILAYEVTKLVHGARAAAAAFATAVREFRAADPQGRITMGSDIPAADDMVDDSVPSYTMTARHGSIKVLDLIVEAGMVRSKGEARRLVTQGGVYVDGKRLANVDEELPDINKLKGKTLLVSLGKKRKRRIVFE